MRKGVARFYSAGPHACKKSVQVFRTLQNSKKKKKPSDYVTKGGSAFSSLWCMNSLVSPAGVEMLNSIENEIRATEALSILGAEVITARSININTDYLLSDVKKALRGCVVKIRKTGFASRAT